MSPDGTSLAAPFVGYIIGTTLFGVTILQAYQYFLRYPNDSFICKLKVSVVCLLDLLHFIFAADVVYTFLITNFGEVSASMKTPWSLQALSATQAILIVFVQLLYLHRIYRLSNIAALNGPLLRILSKFVICIVASSAISIGIVFVYEVPKVTVVPRLGGDFQWLIFLGYGAIGSIDALITAMMCFVLYKGRLEIGINHISRHTNRMLSNLITYALATGSITTLTAILGLILYIVRPDTFLYISVMFSITRVYSNSFLAMLNVRRRYHHAKDNADLKMVSDVVFRGLARAATTTTATGKTSRRDEAIVDASSGLKSRHMALVCTEPELDPKILEDGSWNSAETNCPLCGSRKRSNDHSPNDPDRRFTL